MKISAKDLRERFNGLYPSAAIDDLPDGSVSALRGLVGDIVIWIEEQECSEMVDRLTAQFIAHRAVGNQEQDMENGKLAGYCLVCQIPWPCEYAAVKKTNTKGEK